jgi:hypothetical protein
MTPEQLKISNAAADAALSLLRDEIRAAGLSGLGETIDEAMGAEAGSTLYAKEQAAAAPGFDFGSLINTAIKAAAGVATTKIQQNTLTSIAKKTTALQQQNVLQQQQAAWGMPAGLSFSSPAVLIPTVLGGVLVLYLALKR